MLIDIVFLLSSFGVLLRAKFNLKLHKIRRFVSVIQLFVSEMKLESKSRSFLFFYTTRLQGIFQRTLETSCLARSKTDRRKFIVQRR